MIVLPVYMDYQQHNAAPRFNFGFADGIQFVAHIVYT